jgi:hypothetical protein
MTIFAHLRKLFHQVVRWFRRTARPIWEQCGTSRFSTGRPSIFPFCAIDRGYDDPGILSYAISSFCPTSADGLHPQAYLAGLGLQAALIVAGAGIPTRVA